MFSVVIPLFNKEESIQNTLKSVLKQTVQDFEIIVVNDGSTDESVAKAEEIDDPRIRIVNKENGGVSSARNKGIEEATFEWIAFLDGDDLWKEDHLEEIVQMMKQYPDEKVFVTSFEYSDKRAIYKHQRNSEIFKIDNYFKEAIKEPLICTIIIVINKKCFGKTGLFNVNLNRGEDLDLWARIARHYAIVKSSKVTAIYKMDAENRSDQSFNLLNSRVYQYDFSLAVSKEEIEYYRKQISAVLRKLFLNRQFKQFYLLYKKHKKHINLINLLGN